MVATAKKPTHYYRPERAAKTSGNRPPCCTAPAEDHPAFADGTTVRIQSKRTIRFGDFVFEKGRTYTAERRSFETFRIVSESRWGTNELGQFAELERAVLEDVRVPGYTIWIRDRYGVGIPVEAAKEIG